MSRRYDQSNLDGCLVQNSVSPEQTMLIFDDLPRAVRDAVNYSPYKLCVACVWDASWGGRKNGALIVESEIRIREQQHE